MAESIANITRKSGWSDAENNLLWETADEAQQQGLPLKAVFERIASQTGRRPNSIRNYYYAQVRERCGGQPRAARFVPFTEDEVEKLLFAVLRDRAQGRSVRSCLQRLSGGNHSLMLRYQNKYRSVIKTRPELVSRVVDRLRAEGVEATQPEVNHRNRVTLEEACQNLTQSVHKSGDPELVRALGTLCQYLTGERAIQPQSRSTLGVRLDLYRMALEEKRAEQQALCQAANELIEPVKEYLVKGAQERQLCLDRFCEDLSGRIGALEACINRAGAGEA